MAAHRGDRGDGLWLEVFLTPSEKDHFAEWREVVYDRSLINPIVSPIFNYISQFIPEEVAPNVLTLAGSFATLQAWYFCRTYGESDSIVVSCVSIVSITAFWCLGAIDGKHAMRTMNDTSLGTLFKYCCDLIGAIFLVIVICDLSAARGNLDDQWYWVQTVEMILFLKHYSAFVREAGLRYFLIGPGELISWGAGILFICIFLGTGWLKVLYTSTWGICCQPFVDSLTLAEDSYLASMTLPRFAYIITFLVSIVRIAFSRKLRERHEWTYWSLLCILGMRGASAALSFCFIKAHTISERDVIFDGLFMAVITSDMIVAKMAGREIHSLVVVMASMVLLPQAHFIVFCFVVFYYMAVFNDLMIHMNLPLLQRCTNVYCDGIYDLCHVGHKNLFRRALTNGNRLLVGVVGDEDANNYKRPPIMSASERESEVSSCKCVTKVIPNAPCFGLTEEFIRKHRIHVVAFGMEYEERYPDPATDPYYKVPRQMGIAKPMPRTAGLSTSELISRIQARGTDQKKAIAPPATQVAPATEVPPPKRQKTEETAYSSDAPKRDTSSGPNSMEG